MQVGEGERWKGGHYAQAMFEVCHASAVLSLLLHRKNALQKGLCVPVDRFEAKTGEIRVKLHRRVQRSHRSAWCVQCEPLHGFFCIHS